MQEPRPTSQNLEASLQVMRKLTASHREVEILRCQEWASEQRHGCAGGIVSRMVRDVDFRSSLVNEAHELMAFLQMRLAEGGSAQILGAGHDLLDPVSSAALKQWLQV